MPVTGCQHTDKSGRRSPLSDHRALALSQLRNGQSLQSHRARFRAKSGEIRHVLIDANGWREGGRLLHTRWFVRDISRRVELEREILAVAESERRRKWGK